MPTTSSARSASVTSLVLAFAAVYVIWGSTYLAIRISIETIPPFLMAGVRFVAAGAALYGIASLRGAASPTARQWGAAAIAGALLLLGGNGAVVWAEQWVPSGTVALLVATVPLWMVTLDWLVWRGQRPGPYVVLGLIAGFVGVFLLASGSEIGLSDGRMGVIGAIVVLLGALSWAVGSLYTRTATLPASTYRSIAMQMLTGGVFLSLLSLAFGEPATFDPSQVSVRSAAALVYLIVFGALIGFSAYIWLLSNSTAARVSTYAYVNPVVALFLGWWIVDEPLTPRTLLASAIVVGSVALVTVRGTP